MNGPLIIQVGCKVRLEGKPGWWTVVAAKKEKLRVCQCINTVSSRVIQVAYKSTKKENI